MGNRTSSDHMMSDGGIRNASYSTNNLNQTTNISGTGGGVPAVTQLLEYDASGNLRLWGSKRLKYDDANRLVEIVQLDANEQNSHKQGVEKACALSRPFRFGLKPNH
jgi:hypothetical protein